MLNATGARRELNVGRLNMEVPRLVGGREAGWAGARGRAPGGRGLEMLTGGVMEGAAAGWTWYSEPPSGGEEAAGLG